MTIAFAYALGTGFLSGGRYTLQRVAPAVATRQLAIPRMAEQVSEPRMPAIARPLVPSRELRQFVADEAQPRSQVMKTLSEYAKKNGLQDPNNKSVVRCDAKLKALFGVDECTFLGMSKYITPHLSKPEMVGGKYVEQARTYEKNWIRDNADKMQRSPSKKGPKRRPSASADEARANGTGLWKPVHLSPDLVKICGNRTEMPRQDVIKHVWQYIRDNNLQGKPGEPITCDARLKKVFGADSITARAIMSGIQSHITRS